MPAQENELISTAALSFSGADVKVYATVPSSYGINGTAGVYLKSLQTMSVSTYREVVPVRALGYRNVRGHTRGGRTIAGSMIFALIGDRHPLQDLFGQYQYDYSYDVGYHDYLDGIPNAFPDQIPPFHLYLQYQNEEGSAGGIALIGVEISNDGMVSSIEDMLTENTYQYRARDLKVFHSLDRLRKEKWEYLRRAEEIRRTNSDSTFTDEELNVVAMQTSIEAANQGLQIPNRGFSTPDQSKSLIDDSPWEEVRKRTYDFVDKWSFSK